MRKYLAMCLLFLSLSTLTGSISKGYKYLIEPVNCLTNLGGAVVQEVLQFGRCVYNNITFQRGDTA